jgi:hypothetical protein
MNADVTITYGPPPEPIHGAGILPFMVRPGSNPAEIAFVLGQEAYVPGWNQGGCWSSFEGGTKDGESCEETAAREFVEETMGSIAIQGRSTCEEIAELLRQEQYVARITVDRCCRSTERHCHAIFVLRIPWGTPVERHFNTIHRPIQNIAEMCVSVQRMREREEMQRQQSRRGGGEPHAIYAKRVQILRDTYSSLPTLLRQHAALRPLKTTELESPCVSVNPDYIEKRAVRAVPLAVLQKALLDRGSRRASPVIKLRYSFVPVIKTAIHEITRRAALYQREAA